MELRAALDPIIAIIVGVGWFIVKALLNRREGLSEWDEIERPRPEQPPVIPQAKKTEAPPPIRQRPHTQRPAVPIPTPPPRPVTRTTSPVLPPPVIEEEGPAHHAPVFLKESAESMARGAHLQQSVEDRFAAVHRQSALHRTATVTRRPQTSSTKALHEMFRKPATIQQAFLASFVLSPPKSLEP